MPHSSRQRRGTAYVDASAGIVAWNAVSKTATCGTSGSTAPRLRRAPRAPGGCAAARARPAPSSSRLAPRRRSRPARGSARRRGRRGARPRRSSPGRRLERRRPCRRVVVGDHERELEARRARVDDEDGSRRQPGHAQSRIAGIVLAVLARVGAGAQPRVDHLLAQVRRARRPGRARGRSRPSRGGSGRGR